MTTASGAVPFLDLRRINLRHRAAYLAALDRVLSSGRVLQGEETAAFEQAFASFCGARHCVAVGNGLDALALVLRAWGIGPGDEVIVPSHTFIATWLAVSQIGATPVPVEPCAHGHNIDPGRVEAAVTPRTRAIMPVHLYGRPADMQALREIARRRGLRLLEDAAQAHGAELAGQRCGHLGQPGDAAAFSFYPGKNLGALGDAGAVTTDDAQLADTVRRLGNYGSSVKYRHELQGGNSRIDELQAAFLHERLRQLPQDNQRRADIARQYLAGLAGTPGLGLPEADGHGVRSAWHLFVVRHAQRERLAEGLSAQGIGTLVHYPLPPHRQGAYAGTPLAGLSLPGADQRAADVLSLPMDPTLDDAAVQRVIDAVRSCCAGLAEGSRKYFSLAA